VGDTRLTETDGAGQTTTKNQLRDRIESNNPKQFMKNIQWFELEGNPYKSATGDLSPARYPS